MKRILSLVLVLLIILALPISAMAAEDTAIREAFEATGDYMAALGDPSARETSLRRHRSFAFGGALSQSSR